MSAVEHSSPVARGVRSLRRRYLRPGSPLAGVAYRALMAAALPGLARRRGSASTPQGRSSRALARALGSAALGRAPSEERAWVARCEARRDEMTSGSASARPWISDEVSAASGVAVRPVPVQKLSPWASLPAQWCLFLMRLVRELAPRSCLELGTGFGVSGAYQAAALELNGAGRLITLEAAAEYAAIAEQGFASLGLDRRVEVEVGSIRDELEAVVERAAPIDYALVDADHTEEATLACFRALLPHVSPGAVLVFDDIGWTQGMSRAWEAIRTHPGVSTSVGIRRIGVAVMAGDGTAR